MDSCTHGHPYTPKNTSLHHGYRRCLTCHRQQQQARQRTRGVQPKQDMGKRTHCPNGHEWIAKNLRSRSGRVECKVCHREREKARYHSNPAKHIKAAGEWQRRNRERARAKHTRWREQNREWVREYARGRQRARRVGRQQESVGYAELVRRDPCSYCGEPGGTVDHIEPVALGGSNDVENLTGACKNCNSRKRTRPLLVFLLERAA
jgi:DNA polymerase III alpha subunit